MFLAILGVALLATSVALLSTPFGAQASIIGVENSLETSNPKVDGARSSTPIYSITAKNIKPNPISFFALVEVTYDGIENDVYLPITMIPQSIAANELKELRLNIKCRIFCNTDGSYRAGIYRVSASFWKLAVSQPVICQTDPSSWECGYIQIAPTVSSAFTVSPAPTSITIKTQACYAVSTTGGFVNCDKPVPLEEGKIEPLGTLTFTAGQSVIFTATKITSAKFVKWIRGDGCTDALNCKTSESTQNPFTSSVQNNEVYTAIFQRQPPLTIKVSNPASCTTTPAPGVYEKAPIDKVIITMTPLANVTSTDGLSVSVNSIIGYSIAKPGLVLETITFPPDHPFIPGTKTAKTTREITVDVDTLVLVLCTPSSVITNRAPPEKNPLTTATGLPILPLGIGIAGAVSLFGSFIVGRKTGVGVA